MSQCKKRPRAGRMMLWLLVVLSSGCVGSGVSPVRDALVPEPPAGATLVVLLGTGTPNAEPDRSGPALAVVVGGRSYLVDCGPGVVRRANGAAALGVQGLRPKELRRVFITHLHSDHTTGLADLVFTPWVLERDVPLEVYGPPGAVAMAEHISEAYFVDVEMRLSGLEPANPEGWKMTAREIQPGVVFRDDLVTVEAFRVAHGSFEHAFGFRFITPDGIIAVSGDSAPCHGVAQVASRATLLVHEAYATSGWRRRAPEWQRYHRAFHTSGREVGELAARADVGAVVLTHQLLWGASREELVQETKDAYSGPVYFGQDLDIFVIARGRVSLLGR